jgi:Fe-S cluster biogenesis protein NfuA
MQQSDLDLGLAVQEELNSTIRPLLGIDAGDIEIQSVESGHVELALLGSCSRCIFRANCASYTVLERLEERFEDRGATFHVQGHDVPRNQSRLVSESPSRA